MQDINATWIQDNVSGRMKWVKKTQWDYQEQHQA